MHDHNPIALTYLFSNYYMYRILSANYLLNTKLWPTYQPHMPLRHGAGWAQARQAGSLHVATTTNGAPDGRYSRRSIARCLFACARAMILFDRFCPGVSGAGSFFTNGPYLRLNMWSRIFLGLI